MIGPVFVARLDPELADIVGTTDQLNAVVRIIMVEAVVAGFALPLFPAVGSGQLTDAGRASLARCNISTR